MADTTSRIRIIFDGAVSGLTRAARSASRDLDRFSASLERHEKSLDKVDNVGKKLNSGLLTMAKGFVIAGAGASSLQGAVAIVGTLASVTAQLAPAALAVPGIILGVGVAYGTAKLALSGFTDAVKGDAEALAKLAPAAKDTVGAIRGLSGEFTKLKQAVQEDFFAGLAFDIKETGKVLLDLGQRKLPEVASGFNAMFVEGLRAARTPFFTSALGRIIDNTSASLGRFRYLLANVLNGFVGLGAVGSQYLEPLAAHISRVGKSFQLWVESVTAVAPRGGPSQLERMIDRAIIGFQTLGRILADVGAGFKSLFSAFNEGLTGGGGTLQSIERVTQAFRELAASPQAQAAFKTLGEVVKAAGDAFRLVLTTAIRELGPVITDLGPFLKELVTVIGERMARAIQTVAPYLREFARWLSENKETIAPIVATLLRLAAAFRAIKIARSVIAGITAFVGVMRRLFTAIRNINPALLRRIATAVARFLWPVAAFAGFAAFAKYIDDLNIAAAGGDPEKLDGMAASLHDLIAAGEQLLSGDFAGIFKEIGDEWQVLIDKFTAGESPAGAAAQNINKFFDDLEISLQETFAKIGESFQRDFIDVFVNLGTKIRDSFQRDFIDFFTITVPQKLSEAFAKIGESFQRDFIDVIVNFAKKVAESFQRDFVDFFARLPGVIGGFVATLASTVISGFQSMMSQAAAFVASGIAAVIGFFTNGRTQTASIIANVVATVINGFRNAMSQAAAAVASGIASVVGFFNNLRSQAASIIANVVATVINGFRNAMSSAASAVASGIGTIVGFFRGLPGQILAIISGLAGQLYQSGVRMLTSFADGIRAAGAQALAAARAAVAAVRSVFPFSPAKTGPFSGRGYTTYSGQALVVDFANAIRRSIPAATSAAAALARATSGALDPAISITSAFDAAQLARAQAQTASRNLLGTAVNQVTAVASREQPAPVTNVTVLLSREQIAEIARVVVEDTNRETARRVTAGSGITF